MLRKKLLCVSISYLLMLLGYHCFEQYSVYRDYRRIILPQLIVLNQLDETIVTQENGKTLLFVTTKSGKPEPLFTITRPAIESESIASIVNMAGFILLFLSLQFLVMAPNLKEEMNQNDWE